MADKFPRILIAEDNQVMRLKLREALEKQLNAEVIEATDGEQAWELFNEHDVEFLLTDWMMPSLSGPDLCRRIRSADRPFYTYIILLTGRQDQEDVYAALSAGADDFLRKPYDLQELVHRIESGNRVIALERRTAEQNRQLLEALDAAGAVQSRLLPTQHRIRLLERTTGVRIAYKYLACQTLGGDVLGLVPAGEKKFGLFLADISGHGIPASLSAVSLHTYLQSLISINPDPLHVATQANRFCCEEFPEAVYATLAYLHIDAESGRTEGLIAGHPPVLWSSGKNGVLEFHPESAPLGLFRDPPQESEVIEFNFNPGGRMLAYTDGVTETRNPGGQFFDTSVLTTLFRENHETQLELMPDVVINQLNEWRGNGTEAEDDISILVVER